MLSKTQRRLEFLVGSGAIWLDAVLVARMIVSKAERGGNQDYEYDYNKFQIKEKSGEGGTEYL